MIRWLTSLIRQIVGRFKKVNQTALFVAFGTIFLPLSIYMLIEGRPEDRWIAFTMFITAIILLVMTSVRVIKGEKRGREERQLRDKIDSDRFDILVTQLNIIIKELKRPRKEKQK